MKETIINGKYKLILPDHRADRPEWDIKRGGWEVERIDAMLSILKKGDLVLDVGTEEGDISALLAQKSENIVMFEPNPRVWSNIKAIWEANKLKNPIACWVGFAANQNDYKGDFNVKPFEFPECANGPLISDHGFKELSKEYDVVPQIKIDTLMTMVYAVREQPVKLITIDVEGSEFEVLKGAEETLRDDHPNVFVSVHPEFMFAQFGNYTAELTNFMKDRGYSFEILAFDHEYHFWFKYNETK